MGLDSVVSFAGAYFMYLKIAGIAMGALSLTTDLIFNAFLTRTTLKRSTRLLNSRL